MALSIIFAQSFFNYSCNAIACFSVLVSAIQACPARFPAMVRFSNNPRWRGRVANATMQRRGQVLLRRGRLGRFAVSERARQLQATALHTTTQNVALCYLMSCHISLNCSMLQDTASATMIQGSVTVYCIVLCCFILQDYTISFSSASYQHNRRKPYHVTLF